jgi:hypothetical protein
MACSYFALLRSPFMAAAITGNHAQAIGRVRGNRGLVPLSPLITGPRAVRRKRLPSPYERGAAFARDPIL